MFAMPRANGVLPDLDRCPCCNRALVYVDGDNPSRARHNSTRQVSVVGHAEPLYRQCPHCDARWHRYPRRHPLRSAATVSAGAEADVLALARRFEQPAVQRWTDGSLAVLASGTGDLVVEPTGALTTRVDSRICPMRAVRGEPQEDDVCRDPGGPWVRASMHSRCVGGVSGRCSSTRCPAMCVAADRRKTAGAPLPSRRGWSPAGTDPPAPPRDDPAGPARRVGGFVRPAACRST